jgi:hypothetical protein
MLPAAAATTALRLFDLMRRSVDVAQGVVGLCCNPKSSGLNIEWHLAVRFAHDFEVLGSRREECGRKPT